MSASEEDPYSRGLITYGPDTNCTLAICSAKYSVYEYRPSLAANAIFLALSGVVMIIHVILGLKWRTWFFGTVIFFGSVSEMIGYGGRIMLWKNPFSFTGFLMQISEYKRA